MVFAAKAPTFSGLLTALILLLCLPATLVAGTQELPPKPDRYITDHAGVLDATTLSTINSQLEHFEKDTTNQVVVAIYPSLPPNTDIAKYAMDAFNAWGVGQKGKDNGVVLFIFTTDHQMFLSTGRGMERALPNAACKKIITELIAPEFKRGNFAQGVHAGVDAILAATKNVGTK